MADNDKNEEEALATPLGKAFRRLFEDEDFIDKVIESPADIKAEYGLDDDEIDALAVDARALEGDVAGFGRFNSSWAIKSTGGLRVPTLLGFSTFGGVGTVISLSQ